MSEHEYPEVEYRGYVLCLLRDDLVEVVRPRLQARYNSVEQAQRNLDHFEDGDCSAHGGEC